MKNPILNLKGPILVFSWLAAASVFAAPTVDSILDKHIEAIGGKAALAKLKSRTMKVKMESEALGSSEGEILAKAPNKQRTRIELANSGTLYEGFDGAVAWGKSPWEGLRIKAGDELAKTKRDAIFQRELDAKKIYPDLAFKGTEKIGEEEALVLESKPTHTSKERFFFSAKTSLLIRQESQFEGPQGQVSVVSLPQAYKSFDGIMYPTEVKLKFAAGGQNFEFTLRVLEIKHNVELSDDKFAKDSAT